MKYLSSQPIIFGSENNENYELTWERIFSTKCEHTQELEKVEGKGE
jgi:hypothetical protein